MAVYGQCCVTSATIVGVHAVPVSVEAVVSPGLPGFTIVGMPDVSVKESRERVRSALRSCGFNMPPSKIVVNLAPSSLRKSGSAFDLPIAIALLVATEQLPRSVVDNRLFVGELSMSGGLRAVHGTLAYALCAKDLGCDLVCSSSSDSVRVDGVDQLGLEYLGNLRYGSMHPLVFSSQRASESAADFSEVSGHESAKRALQVAAAGSHGVLMMGPPGSGKTMLASRIPSILPPLTADERLEAALVHSIAGEPIASILSGVRPFRMPHHSASLAGLVGGGTPLKPGEVSLAHKGVLFLDELAEFKATVLQGIRQPLESGEVSITRANGNVTFPARFMVVAASNPCPCGYYGDDQKECHCTVPQIRNYQGRIGGPLLDRIDIHLDVRRIAAGEVIEKASGSSSGDLQKGVLAAREYSTWRRDVRGDGEDVIADCRLSQGDKSFFESAANLHHMSGRAIVRTLSVARTIADMEGKLVVDRSHLCEALSYRTRLSS